MFNHETIENSQSYINMRKYTQSSTFSVDEKITKDNILKIILINIFSSSFNLLCICFIETINLIMMGSTLNSNLNVDSVGLGNLYLNFIGILLGFGMLGGLDTMGSNAYGSGKFRLLGVYTARSRIILVLLFLFFSSPMSMFSNNIFTYLNIKSDLAINASFYIVYMLPVIFLTFMFNLNIRYLQVMNIYFLPSLITISAAVIHFFLCYHLIIINGMEIAGLCISSNITMFYCFLVSTIYIYYSNPCPLSLFLWSEEVFICNDFFNYLKLSVYSGIQHYGDYMGYEIVCFMCSYLSEAEMAATLIVLNWANLIGFIWVGFSFPLSHMVGFFMGEKDFEMYELCLKIYFNINTITAVILGSITYFFSDYISGLYTSDVNTRELVSLILKYTTILTVCDIYNIMYQAILKGAGKQHITSIWNLTMSIVWMIPVSYYFGFVEGLNVLGIWIGCISYVIILMIVNVYYYSVLDIKKAAYLIDKEMEHNHAE